MLSGPLSRPIYPSGISPIGHTRSAGVSAKSLVIKVSVGIIRLQPNSFALAISSFAKSSLSSSTSEVPTEPPIALTKVKPIPPPITTVPTFSTMLVITPIFELTLAPPIIATVEALSLPNAFEMLSTSPFISVPKPLLSSSKNSAIIAVDA